MKKTVLIIAGALALGVSVGANAQQSDTWQPPYGGDNYYSVYLAPATHGAANVGCDSYSETDGAYWIAYDATTNTNPPQNFRAKGYTTHIGRRTSTISGRIADARTKGVDVYIAIHSNARAAQCSPTPAANYGGTWSMYSDDAPGFNRSLAIRLNEYVSPRSPGTNDKVCTFQTCTNYKRLGEAQDPSAYAYTAYLETEFHTWTPGTNFLYNDWSWRTNIAEAVDAFLGYPSIYH